MTKLFTTVDVNKLSAVGKKLMIMVDPYSVQPTWPVTPKNNPTHRVGLGCQQIFYFKLGWLRVNRLTNTPNLTQHTYI